MKRSNIVFLLIIIMAGIGIYKTKFAGSDKVNPESQTTAQQNDNENTSLVLTDEGVGLTDEAKKSIVSTVIENPIPDDSSDQSSGDFGMEEEVITITGPNTLPKEECMKKYKKVIPDIAYYANNDDIMDYYKCHAIVEKNMDYCGNHNCGKHEIYDSQLLYNVLTGKFHNYELCKEAYSKVKVPGMTVKSICDLAENIMARKVSPPAKFADQFVYVYGRPSACSVIKKKKERDSCILMADLVSGVKTGISKYYLYDAFHLNTCQKVDQDVLERYCSNKLISKEQAEARMNARDRKRKGNKNNY